MTYFDIARLADDSDFLRRVAACRTTEVPGQDPWEWTNEVRWAMAGQPGFGEAYGYALETGNPNPGSDPAVITDGMILSAAQALSGPPADEPEDEPAEDES